MKIRTMVLGDYQTNCYLVSDEDGVTAVIDPGDSPDAVAERLRAEKLTLGAILLTHGHFDHVGAVRALAEATGCPVYLNEKELALPSALTAGKLYYTDACREGDEIAVGTNCFTVLETPGHTPGSVCFCLGDVLFVGDTLFCGSCGRVDLVGGNAAQMRNSLRRLAATEGNFSVLCGHGEPTTLNRERESNPYLRGAAL